MNAKVPEAIEEWLVVLRGDGTVDAVEGGAPVTWLGRALVEATDAPSLLRRAAKELVERDPSTGQAVGVALLMVRDIVAAHRGSVEATSSAAWGTKLVIELPRGRGRRAS